MSILSRFLTPDCAASGIFQQLLNPSIYFISLLCCLLLPLASLGDDEPSDPGAAAFRSGDFQAAMQHWQSVLAKFSREDDPAQYLDTSMRLAITHLALGNLGKALSMIREVLSITKETGDFTRRATALSHLADVYLTMSKPQEAWEYLQEAGTVIDKVSYDPSLRANILTKQGNVLMAQGKYSEALAAYRSGVELARQADDSLLIAKTEVNIVEATLLTGSPKDLQYALRSALHHVQALRISQDKAFALISLAQFMLDPRAELPSTQTETWRLEIYRVLTSALAIGESLRNARIKSYAKGHLGELYAHAERFEEAIRLTAQAIFLAQQNPELVARWELQLGRLLKAENDLDAAIEAYRRALDHLRTLRYGFRGGYRSLSTALPMPVAPYLELVDVLFLKAAQTTTHDLKHTLLLEAAVSVERFSAAELQEFLLCGPSAWQVRDIELEPLSENTAVLYPVLLADRVGLLLRLPEGMRQYRVGNTNATRVEDEAKRFRQKLEDFTPAEVLLYGIDDLLEHSRRLYRWLIQPIAPDLAKYNIETLILVLHNRVLATIPFAALHDGKRFLIEQYALAATPGLITTTPGYLVRKSAQVLLAGLSFTELSHSRHVPEELQGISRLWGGDILLDEEVMLADLEARLRDTPYSVIHFATHAHFNKDPANSFVQTYDAKLAMDRLEQLIRFNEIRGEPLELITFSGSETAQGDERSSLGLASIAIKAGARSALASLWPVSDLATARLMIEFYRQWKEPGISKAKALQAAQMQLLEDYEHPYFWAAFILIGSWL